MKIVTVELAEDEVLIAIKRGEDYEDVCDEIVADDFVASPKGGLQWRLIEIVRGGER